MIDKEIHLTAVSANEVIERVGQFEMDVVCAEPSPHATEHWSKRIEMLTSWLLGQWEHEQLPGPRQGGRCRL